MVRHVTRERNILAAADSPFVVKCHYAFTTAKNIYLVMEYVPGSHIDRNDRNLSVHKQAEIVIVCCRIWELWTSPSPRDMLQSLSVHWTIFTPRLIAPLG